LTRDKLIRELDPFFKASSVAVVGASTTPGKIGHEILRSLAQYDYKGRVYPVNPNAKEILGLRCYPRIQDIPGKIDLAVIALPSSFAPDVIEQCGRKGVKACVVVSGGFKELGEDCAKIEQAMMETARKYRIRIIGPNCIGIFDSKTKIDTFFQSHERMLRPRKGTVSFITQSGTIGCTLLEWAAENQLGISKFVSYGNRADVDEADLVRYLGADPETSVIGVYVEGFGDGRRFLGAAKDIVMEKALVVLKSGRTALGAKAALSHTGWLAGSYAICESALKQYGILTTDSFQELFDAINALAKQPPSKENRIAMVTNGAGPCVMAADECMRRGVKLASYSKATVEKLKESIPPYCVVGNPVDLTGTATSNEYRIAIEMLLRDPNVDLLMPFFVFQDSPLDENIIDVVADSQRYGKPVLCCASGGPYTREQSTKLEGKGVPVYATAERAVAAAHALILRGKVLQSTAPVE